MWVYPLRRSSALLLSALVVFQCIGCGTETEPSPEGSAQVDASDRKLAAKESEAPSVTPSPDTSRTTSKPSTQAEVRAPHFDWLKFTKPGDVTRDVLPYIHNHTLDLGGRKITASGEVRLVKAEIESGKLLLTMRMNRPKQQVRFEGMPGAMGTYHPNGRRMRPVLIRGESHQEQFVFGGVLRVGISHPHPDQIQVAAIKPPSQAETFRQAAEMMREVHKKEAEERARRRAANPVVQKPRKPEKPMELLPGPESGYKPRSLEFAKLAVAVSAMYKMPGRDTFRPVGRAKMEAAQAAAAYPDPKLQKYAVKMLERIKEDQNIDVRAVRQQLIARALQLENMKLGYGTATGSYTDSNGRTVTTFARGDEPDVAAQSKARELFALAKRSDDEIREYVKTQLNQNNFEDLFFGDGITNRLEDLYENILIYSYKNLNADARKAAGPKSATCLIALFRRDSSTSKLRNISGKTLTDVVVDLSWGVTRSEKLKTYGHGQFVFVPVWKPDEELELQEVQLREPSVLHAKVNVFANEARSEEHAFSFVDPRQLPNNKPGAIVLSEHRGFFSFGKKRFAEIAWAEIDGKRIDWKTVEQPLETTVEPGEYKVVVRAREKGRRARIVYEGIVRVDGEERKQIQVTFQK